MVLGKINIIKVLALLSLFFIGQAWCFLIAADIEFKIGDRRLNYNIARDEIAYRSGGDDHFGLRVEKITTGFRRLNQSYAELSQQGAMPVLYSDNGERTSSNRRFGTPIIIIEMTNGEPDVNWFRPAPLEISQLSIPGLALDSFWRAQFESPWAALQAFSNFEAHSKVKIIYPELGKKSLKRLIPNDPRFGEQYQLYNIQPTFIDLNVASVWDTYRGANSVIGIVDDGINYAHSDLNIRSDIDVNYDSGDPSDGSISGFSHGTGVAGIAAARGNNGVGVAGVAFEGQIVSLKLTAGIQTDSSEASAFAHQSNLITVKNYSWGPTDDGFTLEGPGPLGKAALAQAAQTGRDGLGSIHVWAAGNGGALDDLNKDGYANSIYTIAVGALNMDGSQASFSESSTSLICTAPVANGILTTNGSNSYIVTGGTSAAAPSAAGVVALMLQANPQLGWRDVQDILIRTAAKVQTGAPGWVTNAAGLSFNRSYGAGKIDAQAAVDMALDPGRDNLGAHTKFTESKQGLEQSIPDNSTNGKSFSFNINTSNFKTEHISLKTNIIHGNRGDLEIEIISPSGTNSKLIKNHQDTNDNYFEWEFMSVFYWGEDPNGVWTVFIRDLSPEHVGLVQDLELSIFGSGGSNPDPVISNISIPNQVTSFNGPQQALDILPYTGLGSLADLKSLTIEQNSNPSLLQKAEIQGSLFIYQPNVGANGIAYIEIEAKDQSDNIYIGSFQVIVPAPDVIQVTLPDKIINQDSGQHSVSLLPFSDITNISQLSSIILTSNSNAELLSGVVIDNQGYLNFDSLNGEYGETTLGFTAEANNGQPYAGAIKIIVNQVALVAFVPNQIIDENSGSHFVDIYSLLQLSSPSELTSLTLTGNTYPGLLKRAEMSNGQFVFEPFNDKIGATAISFEATTSQLSFTGSFSVTVTPITRVLELPDQEVYVNANQQSLSVFSYTGLSSVNELNSQLVISQSNPDLLSAILMQAGQLIWQPVSGQKGENLVTIKIQDIYGRSYEGSVKLIVTQQRIEALVPNQQVTENSGAQSLNLLSFLPLNNGAELASFNVLSQTNSSLLSSFSEQAGLFIYTPAQDAFGSNALEFEAESTDEIIYFGQFEVAVSPLEKVVSIPAQNVFAGSSLTSVNLLPYFGLTSFNQIASFTFSGSTNSGLLSTSIYENGFYRFQPTFGSVGSTEVPFTATGSDGRPYSGKISVTVSPSNLEILLPDISASENSGQQAIDLSSLIAQSDTSPINSFAIDQNTNPSLFSFLDFNSNSGSLEMNIAPNKFGQAQIAVSGTLASGRTFSGSFSVVIQPNTKLVLPPNITLSENSTDHSIPIVDYLGLSGTTELVEVSLTNITNESLLTDVVMDGGFLKFNLRPDSFGSTAVFFTALDSDGRPYNGSFAITITPDLKEVIISDKVVQENSGVSQIDLLPVLGVEQPQEVAEVAIVYQSNPGLISTINYINETGLLEFGTVSNVFGESAVSIAGELKTGRPFSGSLNMIVTPITREIDFPPFYAPENGGQRSVDLVEAFGFNSVADIILPEVLDQSNPVLFSSLEIDNGYLIFNPTPDFFGENLITISVIDGIGRPHIGELNVIIQPSEKAIEIPDQVVNENSGSHNLSVYEFITFDAGTELVVVELFNVSNPGLFTSIDVLNGVVQYTLKNDRFGSTTIVVTAEGSNGRQYEGSFKITITPNLKEVVIPDKVVQENSGVCQIDLLPILGGEQPQEVAIVYQSNPGLISTINYINETGLLEFGTVSNVFGESAVSIAGELKTGRPFSGSLNITVVPNTRDVILSTISLSENAGQQLLNLNTAFELNPLDNFISSEIISQTNAPLFSSINIEIGNLIFVPRPNVFGENKIIISAINASGRPYLGELIVSILPNQRNVSIPNQVVSENTGQHILALENFIALDTGAQIAAAEFEVLSNPDLFSGIEIVGGSLLYTPRLNTFGSSDVNIFIQAINGRTYQGSFEISITPNYKSFVFPNIFLEENSDPEEVDLALALGLSNANEISEVLVKSNSNPSLIPSVDYSPAKGRIEFSLSANTFGDGILLLDGILRSGRPFSGRINVTVIPAIRELDFPPMIIPENSIVQSIDLKEAFGIKSPNGMISPQISAQTNPDLFHSLEISDGALLFIPTIDLFGVNDLTITALDTDGRPYVGKLSVIVEPLIRIVNIPPQNIVGNFEANTFDLVGFFPFDEGDYLGAIQIDQITDQSFFQSISLIESSIQYQLLPNTVGTTIVNFSATSNVGRPFRGEFVLNVSNSVEEIILDDHVVMENTSETIINVVPFLNQGTSPEIINFEITAQSNPNLITGYDLNEGAMVLYPALNKFGENIISFQLRVAGGQRFDGTVKLIIDPIIESILFDEILLESSPTQFEIDLNDHSKVRNLTRFTIEGPVSNELVSQIAIDGAILKIKPNLARSGELLIGLKAFNADGRPFHIQLPIILDSFKFWMNQNFDSSELVDPALEQTLWGREADPDGDGWDNYSEYALGGNPKIRELKLDWISVSLQKIDNNRFQLLKLRIRNNDENLLVIPQISYDRNTWSNVPLLGDDVMELVSIENETQFTVYTLRSLKPLSANTPEYLRVLFDRID